MEKANLLTTKDWSWVVNYKIRAALMDLELVAHNLIRDADNLEYDLEQFADDEKPDILKSINMLREEADDLSNYIMKRWERLKGTKS